MDINRLLIDRINAYKEELRNERHKLQMIELDRPLTDNEIWEYAILQQCAESLIQTCLNLRASYLIATTGTLDTL